MVKFVLVVCGKICGKIILLKSQNRYCFLGCCHLGKAHLKQDGIHRQGPMPHMALSVPKRNKKLEVGRKRRRRRRKSQSEDPHSARGRG